MKKKQTRGNGKSGKNSLSCLNESRRGTKMSEQSKPITNNLKTSKGFTLIEVIMVMLIVGNLAAILIPSYAYLLDKVNYRICHIRQGELRHLYQVDRVAGLASPNNPLLLLNSAGSKDGMIAEYKHGYYVRGGCPIKGEYTVEFADAMDSIGGKIINTVTCEFHDGNDPIVTPGLDVEVNGLGPYIQSAYDQVQHSSGSVLYLGYIDSTAIRSGDVFGYYEQLRAGMEENALLDMDKIASWAVQPENGVTIVWYTDVDISKLKPGDLVRVIRYNAKLGTHTAGYIEVIEKANVTPTYNVFNGGVGKENCWKEADGQTDTDKTNNYKTIEEIFNNINPPYIEK